MMHICNECRFVKHNPLWMRILLSLKPTNCTFDTKELNYVTGEMESVSISCEMKNWHGNCPDFKRIQPKEPNVDSN